MTDILVVSDYAPALFAIELSANGIAESNGGNRGNNVGIIDDEIFVWYSPDLSSDIPLSSSDLRTIKLEFNFDQNELYEKLKVISFNDRFRLHGFDV